MRKLILLWLIAVIASGCRVYISVTDTKDPFITLDSTYDYYIREYYVEERNKRYRLMSKQEADNNASKKLIEVEYLFVSNDEKRNVIYLTTVPDRRQKRYSEDYPGRNFVNMHDVRMLHFGIITGEKRDEFLFTDFNNADRDVWSLSAGEHPGQIKVNTLMEIRDGEFSEMMLVDSALSEPVIFEKVDHFRLVYFDPKKSGKDTALVDRNRIFYHKENPRGITVYYDRRLPGGHPAQSFPKKQIVYDPKNIFIITP
jgi:hypothetical protein